MKLTMVVSLLVAVAAAIPAAAPAAEPQPFDSLPLEKRQGCGPCIKGIVQCCSAPYCYVYKC